MDILNLKKILLFWLIPLTILALWYFKEFIIPFLAGIILGSAIQSLAFYLSHRLKINYYFNVFLIYSFFSIFFILSFYLTYKVLIVELPDLFQKIPSFFEMARNFAPKEWKNIFLLSTDYFPTISRFIFSLFGGIVSLILVFIISLYVSLIKNFPENLLNLFFNFENKEEYLKIWRKIRRKIGFWFLGQLLLMIFIGFFVYLFTSLVLKSKYSLLIALIAGILEIVPILGPTVSLIIGSLIVFIDNPSQFFMIIIYFILLQQVENYFLVPLIMKKSVALDPLLVILGILIGGKLGGIFGIILIIPLLASIFEIFHYFNFKVRGGVIGSTQDPGS